VRRSRCGPTPPGRGPSPCRAPPQPRPPLNHYLLQQSSRALRGGVAHPRKIPPPLVTVPAPNRATAASANERFQGASARGASSFHRRRRALQRPGGSLAPGVGRRAGPRGPGCRLIHLTGFVEQLSDDAAPQPSRIPRPHRSSHGSCSIVRFCTMRSLATASRGGDRIQAGSGLPHPQPL
jgi:hypothetical protein